MTSKCACRDTTEGNHLSRMVQVNNGDPNCNVFLALTESGSLMHAEDKGGRSWFIRWIAQRIMIAVEEN